MDPPGTMARLPPLATPVMGSNDAVLPACSARRRAAHAALWNTTLATGTSAAACAMAARREGPSAPSELSAPGAHQGRLMVSTAAGGGSGDAEGGAPMEPLGEGVRLEEREPDCVMVMEFVELLLREDEGVGGVEGDAVAEADADAAGVTVPDGLPLLDAVRVPPSENVGVPEGEPDPVGTAVDVDRGLVPTVEVDVCDAEAERVEEAEGSGEGDAEAL